MDSSLKCKQHKSSNCEFVCLIDQPNNAKSCLLICQKCINESNGAINPIDCVPLTQILEVNSSINLSKYAPLSLSQLSDQLILDISSFSIDAAIVQIKEFFKELMKNFKDKINELLSKSQESIENLYKRREAILQKYKQVSSIELLKEIIQSNSKQVSEIESELYKFKENQQNDITALIEEVKLFNYQRYSIEKLQQPQQIIDNIFKEIQTLEIFNIQPLQSGLAITNQSCVSPTFNNQVNEIQITSKKSINSIINQITILTSDQLDTLYFFSTPIVERLRDNSIKITSTCAQIQCFIEPQLFPTKKYIITIKAQTDSKKPFPYFFFGLMPYSTRLDRKIANQQMCYNEISSHFGISKMVKGKQLHLGYDFNYNDANYWHHNDSRRFEIRINLSKQFMRIACLPDYNLVAEFDDKSKITNDKDYVFAFSTIGDQNSVTVEDIQEVNDFDNKM